MKFFLYLILLMLGLGEYSSYKHLKDVILNEIS